MLSPISTLFILYIFISRAVLIHAAPFTPLFTRNAGNSSTTDFRVQNGLKAQQLNAQFASLTASDPCKGDNIACINNSFAQCAGGKWALSPCSAGLGCYAFPFVNSPGASIACDTQQDALARISASGATGGLMGTFGNATTKSTPALSSGTRATSTVTVTPTKSSTMTSIASTPTVTSTTNNTSGSDSNNDHDCDDTTNSSTPGNTTSTSSDVGSGDHTSGTTVQGGNSTSPANSNSDGNDCDGDDGTTPTGNGSSSVATPSSTASAYSSTESSSQIYRRQFISFTSASNAASFRSPFQTGTGSSPSLLTFSGSPTSTGTIPTAPFSSLPTTTATAVPSVSTVTLMIVSTVTVTASSCQSNGSPISFPTNSAVLPNTSESASTFVPPASSAVGTNPTSSTNTVTFAPAPSQASSTPPNNAYTAPTVSSSSTPPGAGASGISFTTKGNAAFEPVPTPTSFTTTMTFYPTNGPSSSSSDR